MAVGVRVVRAVSSLIGGAEVFGKRGGDGFEKGFWVEMSGGEGRGGGGGGGVVLGGDAVLFSDSGVGDGNRGCEGGTGCSGKWEEGKVLRGNFC